jgi:hypothetical protein
MILLRQKRKGRRKEEKEYKCHGTRENIVSSAARLHTMNYVPYNTYIRFIMSDTIEYDNINTIYNVKF